MGPPYYAPTTCKIFCKDLVLVEVNEWGIKSWTGAVSTAVKEGSTFQPSTVAGLTLMGKSRVRYVFLQVELRKAS